jgi:hypothetical protein
MHFCILSTHKNPVIKNGSCNYRLFMQNIAIMSDHENQRIIFHSARRQQAREQHTLVDQMCEETGLSLSALAREAGAPNSTLTRYRKLGHPNKLETIAKLINTYVRIMELKGLPAADNVLRYQSRIGLADGAIVTDPTPDRLMLAISTANEDFKLGLSDSDIRDLCNYTAELYQVIIEVERRIGASIPNDENGRATLRRALFAERQDAKRLDRT